MSFSSRCSERSLLDNAILVSVAAMAALNVLFLAQQLHPTPTLAANARTTAALA